MYEVIYLFVLALAALPLASTLLQGGRGNHIAFVHRLYRDAAYILAAGLGIIIFEAALGISLENYWFEELGQSHRYWLSLEYRIAIFLVILLLVGLFIGANLRLLSRSYAVVPASAPWIVCVLWRASPAARKIADSGMSLVEHTDAVTYRARLMLLLRIRLTSGLVSSSRVSEPSSMYRILSANPNNRGS
jgi:hypothetical protein